VSTGAGGAITEAELAEALRRRSYLDDPAAYARDVFVDVRRHRESEYEPDEAYQDPEGNKWIFGRAYGDGSPYWLRPGMERTFADDIPRRPLVRLVPEGSPLADSERDLIHADLGHLLEALGLDDYARPESTARGVPAVHRGGREAEGGREAMTEQQAPAFPGVTRWRRKSAELETVRWDGTAASATVIIDWILANGGTARYHDDPAALSIDIPGGTVDARPGDRIIRCPDGVFRPLAEGDFFDLHEPVGVLVSGEPAFAPEIEEGARDPADVLVGAALIAAERVARDARERAEAAEAKLAAIAERCNDRIDRYMEGDPGGIGARFPDDVQMSAVAILAIIASEEEAGRG
jgi:hypothetical protein